MEAQAKVSSSVGTLSVAGAFPLRMTEMVQSLPVYVITFWDVAPSYHSSSAILGMRTSWQQWANSSGETLLTGRVTVSSNPRRSLTLPVSEMCGAAQTST